MYVLVYWVNHCTSHSWPCGYNKTILAVIHTRGLPSSRLLFGLASFFGVVAVSVDRFLAIHLHLRYQELVTHKRVVAVVISIWVLTVFLSLMTFWVSFYIGSGLGILLGGVGFFFTAVVYIRIYFAVQRHKNQIRVLQVQQAARNDEIANLTSLVKSAFGIFYVFLLFLICYLPSCIVLIVYKISGPSIPLKKVLLFSGTLGYLNSSLNPVIYGWKMAHIRHAVMGHTEEHVLVQEWRLTLITWLFMLDHDSLHSVCSLLMNALCT